MNAQENTTGSQAGRARSPKEQLILDCALKLLIETGDAGLTMRKLAESAGMRLSNVQYYFKSRDDVLQAMVGQYFEDCTENLGRLIQESDAQTVRGRVLFLARAGLSHGEEISDMCRAFREIWAISSRNQIIDRCLMDYYRTFAELLVRDAIPQSTDDHSRRKLETLLVTFFEGYSITARALPLNTEEAAEMLTDLAMSFVK
ncbi:TetR/AcrR family transcriptional regulator [Mameliella alba]|nr:TetR/AcrR family transcriptional regulator [Mameliella alba]MCA0956464.1 TetR/AcrR family transcriptional regulator [Mameliella alba]